jgi:hypothetical protein
LVFEFVIEICAAAITAPVWSVTVPSIVPPATCPFAGCAVTMLAASKSAVQNRAPGLLFMLTPNPPKAFVLSARKLGGPNEISTSMHQITWG